MSDAYLTIRPGVAFGAPCVGRTGTAAWAIVGPIWAGDAVNDVAKDYDLTRNEVLVACWFVATYGVESAWWNGERRHRPGDVWTRRWGTWASKHAATFWRHEFDEVPDPPTRPGDRPLEPESPTTEDDPAHTA